MLRRNRTAMTTVELLVAFVIVAIGGALLLSFLQRQNDFLGFSVVQGDIRTRGQLALDIMANELRQATLAAAGSPPNVTITTVSGNPTLTLYLPADMNLDGRIIDGAGDIEWNTANEIRYEHNVALGQLRRIEGAVTRVIANHVAGASFENAAANPSLNPNELRLQLTLQQTTSQQRQATTTVTAMVMLRN